MHVRVLLQGNLNNLTSVTFQPVRYGAIRVQVLRAVLADDLARHQANDGEGAHRNVPGGAEEEVDEDREKRHVDPDDRGQIPEQPVRHALRDVHNGHRYAGYDVRYEVRPPFVLGQPMEHRHEGP